MQLAPRHAQSAGPWSACGQAASAFSEASMERRSFAPQSASSPVPTLGSPCRRCTTSVPTLLRPSWLGPSTFAGARMAASSSALWNGLIHWLVATRNEVTAVCRLKRAAVGHGSSSHRCQLQGLTQQLHQWQARCTSAGALAMHGIQQLWRHLRASSAFRRRKLAGSSCHPWQRRVGGCWRRLRLLAAHSTMDSSETGPQKLAAPRSCLCVVA
mmetsp:Transcript_82043/g.145383  ORF Transcript_82043/g.145383 Transcript_82043/m.145383 type:complete len:213 (-) Transcript_82043:497-1135(-)